MFACRKRPGADDGVERMCPTRWVSIVHLKKRRQVFNADPIKHMAIQQSTDFPLPSHLPQPFDDGAADHLRCALIPSISLPSTAGGTVDLSALNALTTVLYCYPMTGVPGKPLPQGWDLIPGARGCTPQTCSFRDHHREFLELGPDVFGVSTHTTEYQREMVGRLQ